MTLGTKVRTFTKVSYSEVIRRSPSEHGLAQQVDRRPPTRHDYLMQADSDFGFLNEIADRTGMRLVGRRPDAASSSRCDDRVRSGHA